MLREEMGYKRDYNIEGNINTGKIISSIGLILLSGFFIFFGIPNLIISILENSVDLFILYQISTIFSYTAIILVCIGTILLIIGLIKLKNTLIDTLKFNFRNTLIYIIIFSLCDFIIPFVLLIISFFKIVVWEFAFAIITTITFFVGSIMILLTIIELKKAYQEINRITPIFQPKLYSFYSSIVIISLLAIFFTSTYIIETFYETVIPISENITYNISKAVILFVFFTFIGVTFIELSTKLLKINGKDIAFNIAISSKNPVSSKYLLENQEEQVKTI